MNKTRFYEILQALKNGEDLNSLAPTNAAEAELIANIQIASGGSGSGSGDAPALTPLTKNEIEEILVSEEN